MGIMDAVKKGFGIATKSVSLVGILIAFNLVWNLLSIPFARSAAAPTPQITVTAAIFGICFILLSIFVQGGALGLVRDFIKEGKMKLGAFASYGAAYYVRLLCLGLVIVLAIAIVGIVAALIVAATAPLNNVVVTSIAAIIAIAIGAVGLYCVFLLIFSPYIIVCDGVGVVASVKTSMKKVRGALLKVLGLLVVLILISLGIGFLLGLVAGLIATLMPIGAGQVLIGIVNSVFNGYLGVVMMAAFMVFYMALAEKGAISAAK